MAYSIDAQLQHYYHLSIFSLFFNVLLFISLVKFFCFNNSVFFFFFIFSKFDLFRLSSIESIKHCLTQFLDLCQSAPFKPISLLAIVNLTQHLLVPLSGTLLSFTSETSFHGHIHRTPFALLPSNIANTTCTTLIACQIFLFIIIIVQYMIQRIVISGSTSSSASSPVEHIHSIIFLSLYVACLALVKTNWKATAEKNLPVPNRLNSPCCMGIQQLCRKLLSSLDTKITFANKQPKLNQNHRRHFYQNAKQFIATFLFNMESVNTEVDPLQASTTTTGNGNNRRTSDVSNVANGNGNALSLENGKPYKNYNNLKNIIKRAKNEVSFEETVSLLGGDTNPIDGSNRRNSTISNTDSSINHQFSHQSDSQPCLAKLSPITNITTNPKCDNSNSSDDSQSSANNLRFSLPLNSPTEKKDSANGTTYPKKSILSNHSQSQCSTSNYKRPPDGGWGWVVVFASFMINLIADGVSLSFGVIYVELVDYFGESKSKTSWVGSLFLSIPLITGPIASALTDHFGCRKVAIAGSILAALGFFLGHFSTKIEHLFFAFSLSGFGLALCSVASIVCVAYYFEKRRSLATGLSVCGTGFGTFLFAPLTIYLLEQFKWRVTLLILAGIFLNIICFAMLIRDLDLENDSDEESSSSEDDSTSDIESNVIDSEMNSIAEEDADSENESEIEKRHHSKLSSALSCHKSHDNSDESLASNHNKRISFSKTARMRHISECEPTVESMPRTCTSLINIPTYIKNSSNDNHQSDSSKPDSGNNDSIGELTFRRGGYLHNLIRYYPHLLSLFLPWNLECNDLTVKTVPSKSREKLPTINTADVNIPIEDGHDQRNKRSPQVEFESPPPSPDIRSSRDSLTHQDSVAIPVPYSHNHDELINFRPGRIGGASRLVRGRGHRHRMHQHHLNNDLLAGGNCLHNLRLQRGSLTYRSAMLIISKYKLKASSAPDIYRTSMATINEDKGFTVFDNIKEILYDMVDLSTFKNIPYTIFCLSNFLLYACIDIPYVYLPDQAITSGSFDKEGSSLLISIIGIFNTLGVVFIGYIGDKPWLDASMIYAFFIAFSGISLAAIPLTTNNLIVGSLTAIYGFAISANYSLVSVILVEFISLDSFTQAYGLLLLVQGIGSLVGPPIVGWLFDTLGTYSEAFYLTGICVLISALFVIPVGKRKNCCLWSYRMSRTGSTASLTFKPLNFLSKGVYGSNVCSKRNNPSIVREYQQNQQRMSLSVPSPTVVVTDQTTSITIDSKVPIKNGHHVVIIDEEDTSGCGGSTTVDDDDKTQPQQTSIGCSGDRDQKGPIA